MFKVQREYIDHPEFRPQFFIMCDESCPVFAYAPFEAGGNEFQQQLAFVSGMLQQGWEISMDRAVCPAHVKKLSAERSLILLPTISALKI